MRGTTSFDTWPTTSIEDMTMVPQNREREQEWRAGRELYNESLGGSGAGLEDVLIL